MLAPRIDLREHHLPWAILSFRHAPRPDKRHRLRPAISVAGVACSKGARGVFVRRIRRVAIAPTGVVAKPSGGDGGKRVAFGGPANGVKHAGGTRHAARDGGFRWSWFPNRCFRSIPNRRQPPCLRQPSRAWASAQRQNLPIFRGGGVCGPVATWDSRCVHPFHHSASVRAVVAERYAMFSIAKRVIASGDATTIGRDAGDRDGLASSRRDVFSGCRPTSESG